MSELKLRPPKAGPSPRAEARGYHYLRYASGLGMTPREKQQRHGPRSRSLAALGMTTRGRRKGGAALAPSLI
jgi:hypothetical protein